LWDSCGLVCPGSHVGEGVETAIPSQSGTWINSVPSSNEVLTLQIVGLYGTPNLTLEATQLNLWLDAGDHVGQGVQAQISYDFTNDGEFDRFEIFSYLALDPIAFTFQNYDNYPFAVEGTNYQPLVGGVVRLDLWQAIGSQTNPGIVVRTEGQTDDEESNILIPFDIDDFKGPSCGDTVIPKTTGSSDSSDNGGVSGSSMLTFSFMLILFCAIIFQ